MAQQHHDLWVTDQLNHYLAGPANAVLEMVGMHRSEHPWSNFMAMEVLVVLVIMVLFALLRSQLRWDKPNNFQQTFEVVYLFLRDQAHDIIGHHAKPFVPFFGTLFLFIVISNLIGIIPPFESPTMFAPVPAGCAIAAFLFYNVLGFKTQGPVNYVKHFAGPVWWLAPLMFPLEIVSHMARPLSLTIRLYANMLAGEQITLAFLALAPLAIPTLFMGLHVFVSLLQAFIFTVLTMIYVAGATEHEEAH